MSITTTKGISYGFICSAVALVSILVVGFGSSVDRVSQAKAQEPALTYNEFCPHHHTWALSGTTGVDDPPCQASTESVIQAVFCRHNHKFALNWTTYVEGDPEVKEWCADHNPAEEVPLKIFINHYHQNAGTDTTSPNRLNETQ